MLTPHASGEDGRVEQRTARPPAQRTELAAGTSGWFTGRFRHFNPGGTSPITPGLPGTPFLPSGVIETYPYTPFQQPDILRNYLQMRATSPRPNDFLGGQFNPQYRSTGFPAGHSHFPYYGGYVNGFGTSLGYGGYDYGGYAFSPVIGSPVFPSIYSTYGSWYPPYLPQERVVIQREIIYMPPESRPEVPQTRVEPPARSAPEPASAEYYLVRPKAETLEDAVQDIRRAWLNGDFSRLRSRVKEDGRVRIYLKGKYQYSVAGDDFNQMTRDAMTRIDTTGFDLDRVTTVGEGRAFAAGKHSYIDPDKSRREVYVSYGLAQEGGRWLITEAGSSTTPVERHME
jgi:hypothetical protein